jgi:4-hydroxybenzoate polyprenyltransferase
MNSKTDTITAAGAAAPTAGVPLVVDLDGTLIHSDLLWEALVLFLRRHFLQVWRLPFWLLAGKAAFKRRLASCVEPDVAALPYDTALLHWLAAQRARGVRLVLATGSDLRFAERIAAHLGIFERVLATEDDHTNLTSHHKAERLTALYGARGFDYVGNSRADVAVWEACRQPYSVSRTPFRLAGGAATHGAGTRRRTWGAPLLKGMRPRQWLKNLLVFVPMLSAHRVDGPTLSASVLAFAAFSLCASSAYLLNDALDAQDDRLHPTKKKRPIAAGTLPLAIALGASPLLALAAVALAAQAGPWLLAAVALYFASTLAYSFVLKRLLMVDVVTLSLLYSMRILGGCAATAIEPSFWLLAFSFFVFLSLAMLKRHSELLNLHRAGKEKTRGRGYLTSDKAPIAMMGVASAFMSTLVFLLYQSSPNVQVLYRHPVLLFPIAPLLVFWLGRLWVLSFRGEVHEDPILHVSRDPVSLAVLGLCAAFGVFAA